MNRLAHKLIGAIVAVPALMLPANSLADSARYVSVNTTQSFNNGVIVTETVITETFDSEPPQAAFASFATPGRPALGYALWDEADAPFAAPNSHEYYGPFRVTAPDTIEMTGTVDSFTPDDFRALIAAHPGITRLVMVECPGSVDDEANLRLARMVRQSGISTYVPANGSVRSGAVELFLAGVTRSAHPDAEFAVHSWQDEDGVEAYQLPANDPAHRAYLDYYRDMGLTADTASRFYALTNSVAFDQALYLKTDDIAKMGLLTTG